MPAQDPKIGQLIQALRQRLAGPRLTPTQAKLYSQSVRIRLGQSGLASFTPAEALERLEEAQILLDAAVIEREEAPSGEWRNGIKRAGEMLEWLGQSRALGEEVPCIALAAAAYQVAGYPALSMGLLKAAPDGSTSQVLRHFLMGHFPDLLIEARQRILEGQDALAGELSTEERIDTAIVTETLRAVAIIAAFMKWGDESRLGRAVEKLNSLAALGRHSHARYSGIMARLCSLVASEYSSSALWPKAQSLGQKAGRAGAIAYERFCRKAFLQRRSLVWRSQEIGINHLLAEQSFVLCTPTGSGKTTVAELALIGSLLGESSSPVPATEEEFDLQLIPDEGPLVLYLVPSRALAAEVERKLHADLSDLADNRVVVTGLYGGTDWGPTDAWLTSTSPTVVVCTYEKAEALFRFLGPLFVSRLRAVIVDEAHSVQFDQNLSALSRSESRSLKLEILLIRLLRAVAGRGCRLIALSAVTAGLEDSLARWLVDQQAVPARSDYRSTRQLVGRLECQPGGRFMIHYDLLDRADLVFAGQTDATPYVRDPFPPHPPAPSCAGQGPLVSLRPYLAWAAFHLAQDDMDGRPHSVLISITSNITTYAKSFLTLIEEDWAAERLPTFFSLPTDARRIRLWNECLETCRDYFTAASPEYRLLEHGIVVHHGKMPALLGRRLKQVIEEGIVRIVMATSTLSEGVNLPVEYILLPEVYRQNHILSPQEFLNLIGRAGRPGLGTEGRTLVLVPSVPNPRLPDAWRHRRLIEGYVAAIRSIQARPTQDAPPAATSPLAELLGQIMTEWQKLSGDSGLSDFLSWLESTAAAAPVGEDIPTSIACLDTLDAFLLAALEELKEMQGRLAELDPAEVEAGLREIWALSLAKVTAAREEQLADIFMRRGLAISTLYPDATERRRIYRTTLPPISARSMLAQIPEIVDILKTGGDYAGWDPQQRLEYVESVLERLFVVPRFAPAKKIGQSKVDWREILRWWLNPEHAVKTPKPEQMGLWHEYAATNFAYKANWALGSVTATVLDGLSDSGMATALSIADWAKTGLPWIAFWLKELLTWGTLDPVAAFLLARGRVVTRADGRERAKEYYDATADETDANAILQPGRIRGWVENIVPEERETTRTTEPSSRKLAVRLVAGGALRSGMLRVFPRSDGSGVEWIRHVIDYSSRAGAGIQIPVADIDGDLDFVVSGKTGLFLFENLTVNRGKE